METNAWEAMVDALHEYEDTHLAEKIYHSRIPEIMERMREREAEIH
jgi:PHD/YefM family antitoxin component YafN of YafNO toxin-antitoxin module